MGRECLGAIKIIDEMENADVSEYRKLYDSEVKKLAQEGATESAELVTKAHLSLKLLIYTDRGSTKVMGYLCV